MKLFARVLLFAIVAAIVLGALVFVWAMQREIDVSTPEARARQTEAMTLGCKLRLPEVVKKAGIKGEQAAAKADAVCACAVTRVIDAYAVEGKIKPSDVTEVETDAAELACLQELTVQ
jgi:hypothetical protein